MPTDRESITETMTRWWLGHDRRDRRLLESCCDDQVRLFVADELVATGPRDVASAPLGELADPIPTASTADGEMQVATTHFKGQTAFEFLDEDHASTETYVIAHVLTTNCKRVRMLVRGLRYNDQFVRRAKRWLLLERRHTIDWVYEQAPMVAKDVRERLAGMALSPGDR